MKISPQYPRQTGLLAIYAQSQRRKMAGTPETRKTSGTWKAQNWKRYHGPQQDDEPKAHEDALRYYYVIFSTLGSFPFFFYAWIREYCTIE